MFRRNENVEALSKLRKFESRDIVKRLGAIPPVRIHIKNHPIDRPVTVFNAAAILRGDTVYVYARVILGYFMYVSAIALVPVPLHDVLSGTINISHYPAEIVIYPSTKYDVWGTEDPRVTEIDGKWYIVYTGRTVNYFNPAIRRERTLPAVAVSSNSDRRSWDKIGVVTLHKDIRSHLVSDKDSFIIKADTNDLLVFHRPHLDDDTFYAVVSKLEALPNEGLVEMEAKDTKIVLDAAPFEVKIGWGTPPIKVGNNKYLMLVHGVDKDLEAYRAFAALITYDPKKGAVAESVTPYYIMEPKVLYELYGDRPLTVFPCGLFKVDDKAIVVYGAGDYVIGFGEIDINELLGILEDAKGEVETQ